MATISAANLRALADSVAKHIIDAAALPGATTGIVTGQTTTLNKIAAYNDPAQENALLPAAYQSVANENAWITQETSYNAILDLWAAVVQAIDAHVGGLLAFLRTNTSQIDPHYLDAHNRAATRTSMTALAADVAYGQAGTVHGTFTATGAGAGSFAAGTAQNANYGNAPLSAFNTGVGATGASAGVYTVTYNAYNSSGVLQTGLTTTVTVPGATASGGSVAVGVSGVAVTNMSLSGGNNGDTIAIKSTALRTPAY